MGGERRDRMGRHRMLETVKSLLIVLLAALAIYLTVRAQLYSDLGGARPSGWVGALLELLPEREPQMPETEGENLPLMAAQAVRIAVSDGADRYGAQYDSIQTDRAFGESASLLSEALASARAPRQIAERQWQQALEKPGIYVDFLGNIPLRALYAWLGEGGINPNLSGSARRMVLAYDGTGAVLLYYSNEAAGMYYACETSVQYEGHLEELVASFSSNGASFAFELEEYGMLNPYVLLLPQPPQAQVYRSANPLAADDARTEQAVRALSFRPQAGAEYPIPDGTMIRDGKETLQIRNDGSIHYNAAEPEASRYPAGEPGDVAGRIERARRLLAGTAEQWCGNARLYLMDYIEEEDGREVVTFGYSLAGAAVQLYEEGYAAKFTYQSGRLTDYVIQFRTYEETGERAILLPERQAAAALDALAPQGRELTLCYEDSGGDSVQPLWTAQ